MYQPLADLLRPTTLDEVYGQEHILGPNAVLRRLIDSGKIPNMVFYGPSGTGKTTVANIIAKQTNRTLYKLNATTASTADIKEIVAQLDSQVCAETVREKMLLCLDKEIPHGTAVEVTRFSERDNGIIDLDVTIYCEKASHKGIIIGKHGEMIKRISSLARQDIEKFMGTKVYMETWVKVKENWRDNANFIRSQGYDEG